MTELPAPDASVSETARAAVQRVGLWGRGLVALFALAALVVAVTLSFLIPALESRLSAIDVAARERAVIEESADLAARLAESATAEQRRSIRQLLIGQIAILDRMRDAHTSRDVDMIQPYHEAWRVPEGTFHRYVQALRTMAEEGAGLLPPLPPAPDEAFAVIDQSLVLQNQRARTLTMMAVAGATVVLGMTVVAGFLSLPFGLRPARSALRTVLRNGRAGGRVGGRSLPAVLPAGPADMMARALDQCRPMVIITTTTGMIEYANASFLAGNGYTAGELVGQPMRILSAGVTPRGTYRAAWEALLDGKVWSGEFCNRRRDGSCYWAQATITPVRDDTGRVVRFIAIEQDVPASTTAESPTPRHAGGGMSGGAPLRNGRALL